MYNTPNYNLNKFQDTDKFSKDYINENFDLIDVVIGDLQETFSTTATGGALTIQEVTQARGGEVALVDRLDKKDIIIDNHSIAISNNSIAISNNSDQLDNIPNHIYITEKAKTVDVINSLTLKSDKTYVDSQLDNISYQASNFPRLIGETNDSLRLQRLFNKAITDKKKVILEPFKIYNCVTKLTIDLSYLNISGNSATLDFTTSTLIDTPVCINLIATRIPPYYNNHIGSISDLEIVGTRATNNKAISFDYNVSDVGVSHIDMTKINIHGFGTGIEYLNHAYLIRHYSIDVYACDTCISMPNNGNDYGENINFYGCAFYNSTKTIYINNANGAFNFTSCSFDYSETFFDCQDGRIYLVNSHIEGGGNFIVGSGNGATIDILNTWVILLQPNMEIIPFQVNGLLRFSNCFLGGFAFGGSYQELQSGTGKVIFNGCKGYNTAEYANQRYGTNSAKVNKNIDVITSGGTEVATDRYTTTNAIVTFDETSMETGESCVKLYKSYGPGSPSSFHIDIPLNSETFGIRLRVKATTSILSDTLIISSSFVSLVPNSKINIALDGVSKYLTNRITQRLAIGDTKPSIGTNWQWINIVTSSLKKPEWCTHMALDLNCFYVVGANSIFIDKIEVYEF